MPERDAITVQCTINGQSTSIDVSPEERLLDVVRYRLGLTGTKEGCGEGECGACTVLIDGLPANGCLIPAWQMEGRAIETVESIPAERLDGLHERGATQCGACTPGVVVTARWLLEHPELLERYGARTLMAGNLCRCTGYDGIIDGITVSARPGERP